MTCLAQKTTIGLAQKKRHTPFAMVGLGPYAKKHYFQLFRDIEFIPSLIVELSSKRDNVENFLRDWPFSISVVYVPDEEKDFLKLSSATSAKLQQQIVNLGITHVVLATEPKAHFAYAEWFLNQSIHVLAEKPLTSPLFASVDLTAADQIEIDFENLLELSEKKGARLEIQTHRRYHPVYLFVLEQMNELLRKFSVPLTYCDIYHCDGMWNMPNEFIERENHPYKYGYGKLLHSGYHFIDLLAILLAPSFQLEDKKPDRGQLYATSYRPLDFFTALGNEEYFKLFNISDYKDIFDSAAGQITDRFGELDFFGLFQFFKKDRCITTCSLSLLQTGFSNRSWTHLPLDTYKSNGRVRHERISLQFGPLMNLQVHSYLSNESLGKEDFFQPGSKRHFDVYIFRNSKLIGGESFQKFDSRYFGSQYKKSFNETSRTECFLRFIKNQDSNTAIASHRLSIQLLKHCARALCRTPQIEEFLV